MEADNKEESASKLKFHYLKSNHFRVVHADGLIGSLTPKDNVFISFYSERSPMPDYVSFEITPDGELGKEVLEERKTSGADLVREVEVGVVFDIDFARSFAVWLTEIIQQFEKDEKVQS